MARYKFPGLLVRAEALGLHFAQPSDDGELLYWCPFHVEGENADLRVHPDRGLWYCFPCGEGGTLRDLIRRLAREEEAS